MKVGVPKERKTLEKRIALTPDGAQELVKRGHQVFIEKAAGLGSHYEDKDYTAVGAKIVDTLKDVWTMSDLIVKVKEPHESEFEFFNPKVTIFDYLHLASMPNVTKAMLQGGITGIAYELVQTEDGRLPLLEPMSEVAGKLSVLNGSNFLLSQNGGRGVLLGGTTEVPAGNVTILGAGTAGLAACEMAIGCGADVTLLDINSRKLEKARDRFGRQLHTVHSTIAMTARACAQADLLIGAVLVIGGAAPKVVTREIIRSMKKGSVFVDISIDQGGCAETSKTTSLEHPVYELDGVIHYCVPNMPAQTARTSTQALTAATLPYIVKLADGGILPALNSSKELRNALNTYKGSLTNEAVGDAVGMRSISIDEALKRG